MSGPGSSSSAPAAGTITCAAPPLPTCPLLYQVRADVLVRELGVASSAGFSEASGQRAVPIGPGSAGTATSTSDHGLAIPAGLTLDSVPDAWLHSLRARGVDILYLLGVWQTGAAGWQLSYNKLLAQGWSAEAAARDAVSSPFAITAFRVHAALGGNAALARLRLRANAAGLRVMVDFVPNHVARDHR